jgi:hypothetical protein
MYPECTKVVDILATLHRGTYLCYGVKEPALEGFVSKCSESVLESHYEFRNSPTELSMGAPVAATVEKLLLV